MGRSAGATLFYGIDFGDTPPWYTYDEDYEEWFDEGVDPEEWVAGKLGLEPPDLEWSEETRAVFNDYWARKRAAIHDIGVEFLHYGWLEEARWAVSAASEVTDAGACGVRVESLIFGDTAEAREALVRFCEEYS